VSAEVRVKKTILFLVISVAVLAILPLVCRRADVLNLMFLMLLFVTLSQSWNILGGYTGYVNLGHACFFGLGSLIARLLWFAGWPVPAAIFVGGLVALIFALIIGSPAFRLRGVYFVFGMLALAEIMRKIVANTFLAISAVPAGYVAEYRLVPRYYLALTIAGIAVAVVSWLSHSKTGLAMAAIREDEETAATAGVNVFRFKLLALALSAFLAGLAGGSFAFFHVSYYLSHPFNVSWTFDALFISYVGGVGTVIGPVVGTLFYVVLREIVSLVLPVQVHVIVFGLLFLLVIIFMPKGLLQLPRKISMIRGSFTAGDAKRRRGMEKA